MDLGTTIEPKSSQLNADDLLMGPITIKITKVTGGETKEQPVKIYFEGDSGKPYMPCKTARRVLVQVWSRDGANYVGRSMTLYRDPDVKFGGIAVGGIRISHMSDIANDITLVLTASKTSRKPFTVKPLTGESMVPVDPEVKVAGDAAAKGGVDSYKTWLASLAPEVKETVQWLHKEWSRVAKAVVVPDPDGIDFDEAATATVEVNPDNVEPGTLDRPADKDPDEPATPQPPAEAVIDGEFEMMTPESVVAPEVTAGPPPDTDKGAEQAVVEAEVEISPLDRKRADVRARIDELPKNLRTELLGSGRKLIKDMTEEDITALLADIDKLLAV